MRTPCLAQNTKADQQRKNSSTQHPTRVFINEGDSRLQSPPVRRLCEVAHPSAAPWCCKLFYVGPDASSVLAAIRMSLISAGFE